MLTKCLSIATLLCVSGIALGGHSPVFLWGSNRHTVPALHSVSQEDFAETIAPLLQKHMVVVFEEDTLSTNDFLCTDSSSSNSCYAYLSRVGEKTYYTNVADPIKALHSLTKKPHYNSINNEGKLAKPLHCAAGQLVFVKFDKTEAPRTDALEAHDAAISAISTSNDCPTLYVYTAKPAKKHRARRSTAAAKGGNIFRQGSQFLIFYTDLKLITEGKATNITVSGMTVTNSTNANQFGVALNTAEGKSLTFNIRQSEGYFIMNTIAYGDIKFYAPEINAPLAFSYHCGNVTLQSISENADSPVYKLHWNSLQLQAPFGTAKSADFKFGESWSCVGFFTPGILMGLFVVILLLLIVFIGICWMMDINTMDRFDDPKGKTITINASE